MYSLKLALQKLLSRPANTFFSVGLFAIGCGIISLLMMAQGTLKTNVDRTLAGIDMVVGAKGSPSQLILSSVLHADYPTGNINLNEITALVQNPLVKTAIPIALGDSYRGCRIVGAPQEYANLYNANLASGTWYQHPLDVVIGASVARATGLTIGHTFYGVHGFRDTGHAHENHIYVVKGILETSFSVLDNLILTLVESVWKVHDIMPGNSEPSSSEKIMEVERSEISDLTLAEIIQRVEAGEEVTREEMLQYQALRNSRKPSPVNDKAEITAMLLQFRSPAGLIQFNRLINESTSMQAASPALELNRLSKLLAPGIEVLMILAWVIIVISAINIFIHLWNTLRTGMSDIALMRVMGAGQEKVFMMLVFQGIVIAAAGWIFGLLLSRLVWISLPDFHFIATSTLWIPLAKELMVLYYAIMAGIVASLLPAWRAYTVDVHFTLTKR